MSERWGMHARPERFWEKVNKDGPIPVHRPDLGPCWIWEGQRVNSGYGMTRWWVGKGHSNASKLAHRMSYELTKGNIPVGKQLDHLCRNRICVNPDHLEPVTNKENVLRGDGLCAENARKIVCKRGHPLTAENVYTNPRNMRTCRTCSRMRERGQI